jgi:hypothetical protein
MFCSYYKHYEVMKMKLCQTQNFILQDLWGFNQQLPISSSIKIHFNDISVDL